MMFDGADGATQPVHWSSNSYWPLGEDGQFTWVPGWSNLHLDFLENYLNYCRARGQDIGGRRTKFSAEFLTGAIDMQA